MGGPKHVEAWGHFCMWMARRRLARRARSIAPLVKDCGAGAGPTGLGSRVLPFWSRILAMALGPLA